MSKPEPHCLPRPEDRRRGDLERLLGCAGALDCHRSEAFAEDLWAEPAAAAPERAASRLGLFSGWLPTRGFTLARMDLQPGR
jgi:hypothetical protein